MNLKIPQHLWGLTETKKMMIRRAFHSDMSNRSSMILQWYWFSDMSSPYPASWLHVTFVKTRVPVSPPEVHLWGLRVHQFRPENKGSILIQMIFWFEIVFVSTLKRRPFRSQSRVFRLYEAFCDKYARMATVTYIFFIIMQIVNHVFIVTGFEVSIELNICNWLSLPLSTMMEAIPSVPYYSDGLRAHLDNWKVSWDQSRAPTRLRISEFTQNFWDYSELLSFF